MQIGIALIAALAAAPTLPPKGAWTVAEAGIRCELKRSFEANGQVTELTVGLVPGGIGFSTTLKLPPAMLRLNKTGRVVLLFGKGVRVDGDYRLVATTGLNAQPIDVTVPIGDGLATITHGPLSFDFNEGRVLTFDTGKSDTLETIGRQCLNGLATKLMIDPAAEGRVATRAKPLEDPAKWITRDYYPAIAVRKRIEGNVVTILTVNQRGQVDDCRVIESSKSPELDAVACYLLKKRGRFGPALDSMGLPLASQVSITVAWLLDA